MLARKLGFGALGQGGDVQVKNLFSCIVRSYIVVISAYVPPTKKFVCTPLGPVGKSQVFHYPLPCMCINPLYILSLILLIRPIFEGFEG